MQRREFLIADTELNDRFNYKSSDASTASQCPKLVIEYTASSATPMPAPSPTPAFEIMLAE
jgi:hypothetical protein